MSQEQLMNPIISGTFQELVSSFDFRAISKFFMNLQHGLLLD